MTTRHLTVRILLALGLVLLAGGLALGFMPRSALGVSCGSAYRGTSDAFVADATNSFWMQDRQATGSVMKYSEACSSTRSGGRTQSVPLLVVGLGLLIAGLVVLAPHDQKTD